MIGKFQLLRMAHACAIRMRPRMFFALLLPGMLSITPVERAYAASVTAAAKSVKPQSLVTTSSGAPSVASALTSPLPTMQKTVPGIGKGTQTAPGLANNPSPYRGGHPVSPSRPGNAGGYK